MVPRLEEETVGQGNGNTTAPRDKATASLLQGQPAAVDRRVIPARTELPLKIPSLSIQLVFFLDSRKGHHKMSFCLEYRTFIFRCHAVCEISDSLGEEYKNGCLVGRCIVYSGRY